MGDSSGGGTRLELDESDTMQLIRQAVLFENEELLSDLLGENPWAIWKVDRHGRTPLMLAAHNGRTSSLQVLLKNRPDSIDIANQAGKTALHLAAEAGEAASAKALIDAGADIFLRDDAGHCALEGAHIACHEHVAAVLIEAIQFENQKAEDAHKRLIEACIEGSSATVDEILTATNERSFDVVLNGRSQEDNTALFIACTNGHPDVVRLLLTKPGHVLVSPLTKDTILHSAVSSQNEEVLRLILEEFPALIANSNCDGASPLHWAAQSGHLGIVKLLLNYDYPSSCVKEIDMVSAPPYYHSIDMNQGDTECRTALYLAVAKNHIEVVQELLQYKCSFLDGSTRCPFQIDVYCSRGRTPLMIASFNQSLPIMGLLLDKGADVNLPLGVFESEVNGEDTRIVGSGALVEATRADAVHIVHYLLDRGALDTGNRALQLAASNTNEKLIRVYLTRLVFPDSENKVNKKNVDVGQIQVGQNLLPSALCPSRAAMLNWAGANLEAVQAEWFISAALQVNPRLRTTRLSLAAITRVDLSSNRLSIFPSVLFQMPSLRILNLADNRLSKIDLPTYYISSTTLEIINLKGNRLETISSQFLAAFPLLHTLDISFNEITSLPEYIWLCPSLKELNVSNNLLSNLPMVGFPRGRGNPKLHPGLIQLTSDTTPAGDLSIDEPPNVVTKPLLRQNVWQTAINLSKVDDEDLFPDFPVTSSSTLTTLNLSNNKFQVYPFCLACTCPRLLVLNLSWNQLTTLPPVACIPAHLRTLDVSCNELTAGFQPPTSFHTVCNAVPPSSNTGGLVRRQSPQRQHRSRSKSAVRSQRSLSVSRHQQPENQLEEACVHKRHDCLQWLKTLNVSGNQLVNLKIISQGRILVPALNVLDLSENSLRTVNADLSKLPGLSVLNLSGNKDVKELPPELGMLSRLWSLSLKNCMLKEPLDSMVNTENCKTMDIVAYLKTILEESKPYRHLRLLILGGDVVGKTTIWNGLRNEAIQKDVKGKNVMVAEWKYEAKAKKSEPANGPVTISAWDFCGQREYYATYQYFLTRRAIYLVVFRITDGDAALGDVQRWLVSIQARAPNSSVILVATLTDQVTAHPNRFPHGYLDDLENKIRTRFFVTDADKRGLPKVVDLLFINAKGKADIKILLNSIYKNVWDVRVGKEKALDQHIPSSYIGLLKATRELANEHNKENRNCVTSIDNFKASITKKLQKYGRPFRDDVEFNAACAFLHESGEIVHFEDAALRQQLFFDPLWLADFLSIYVSLRSSGYPSGLLSQDTVVEKTKTFKKKLRNSIIDLMHKFELALVLHSRLLLVPALLPDEYRLRSDYQTSSVKISTKMSSWTIRHPTHGHMSLRPTISILGRSVEENSPKHKPLNRTTGDPIFTFAYNSEQQLRRLYVMAYVPAGFWGRLITRIIGDQNVSVALEGLFSAESARESSHMKLAADGRLKAEWLVWQTGIEMLVKGHSLFVLKQFLPLAEVRDVDYSTLTIQTKDDQKRWRPFSLTEWAALEMLFPSLTITSTNGDGEKHSMRTDLEGTTRLMALIVDLVDTLLEDWYPGLGTRFVHTSEGDLLVNRLVPCSNCVKESTTVSRRSHDDSEIGTARRDSGSGGVRGSKTISSLKTADVLHCFSIEECMLAGREFGWVECPSHGGIHMKQLAPDTVFADIENSMVVPTEHIKRGRMLGRGAFGFVFRATVKLPSGELSEVAQKMLEPVDPGPGGRASAVAAFKAAADKWRRDSLEFACRAYCVSRQELNLLSRMKHPNVLSLLGVCIQPLSLVVELAPLGALNILLTSHRKSGSKLSMSVIRDSASQIAKALEYLHSAHIIYRDMKSENVLVWRFPPPFSPQTDVLLKLGDYGISRSVLPSGGAKGFGGTEGFMAPEMVRFNGEEEYTQKVDIFSFGMFLYELITLKQPFEGEEHVKERLLEGARPVLLPHELLVPCSVLDLLVQCWETQPELRPSSSQVVGFCTAPEFAHILDVCEISDTAPPCVLPVFTAEDLDEPEDFEAQLWIAGKNVDVLACTQYAFVDNKTILTESSIKFMAKIRETVWICEESGSVTVFSASLHELSKLNLPSLSAPLVRAPQLLPGDVLLLVSQRELILLSLTESNSVSLRASMHSPYPITTAVFVPAISSRQIWTGHADGRITIHHLSNDDSFSFSSSLYLLDTQAVVKEFIANSSGTNVWISLENSSRIHCYDVERRQSVASLDIRKVMPGSETILTLDEDVASNTIVTTMCLLERTDGSQLYVGSSKGLLIVVHANGMQPISACRPFAGELVSLCVVEGSIKDDDGSIKIKSSLSSTSTESGLSWVRERVSETVDRFRSIPTISAHPPAVIASIGQSFRSLSHRFVVEKSLPNSYSAVIWTTDDWE